MGCERVSFFLPCVQKHNTKQTEMSGHGTIAKTTHVDVTKDISTENKQLMEGIETVTNIDKDKKTINNAASGTTSTLTDETDMVSGGTVIVAHANVPEVVKIAKKKVEVPLPAPKKVAPTRTIEVPLLAPKKVAPKKTIEVPLLAPTKVAPKKTTETLPPAPKKVAQPTVDVSVKTVLTKSQDLMHNFNVAATHDGMCVGYFKVEGADAQVLAACAKAPDNTCPATFNADSCVALKPVNVEITKGAKVMMF